MEGTGLDCSADAAQFTVDKNQLLLLSGSSDIDGSHPDSEGCRPQTHKGLIPASVSDGLNRRDHFCRCYLKLCYSVFNFS